MLVKLRAKNGYCTVSTVFIKVIDTFGIKNVKLCSFIRNYFSLSGVYLSTVCPISLISVILLRVVRCGDIDTCDRSEMANCIGKLGGGAKAIKNIYLNSV